MHVRGVRGGGPGRQEAQVVVAVRGLGGAAGVDLVDLRGDLVAGAQPRLAHQREDLVGVVVRERLGVLPGQLLQRVPHPVVGARRGEMVARDGAGRALRLDQRLEGRGGPVHDRGVREGTAEDGDPRPVGQGPDHLLRHRPPFGLPGGAQPFALVEGDVVHHLGGVGVVGRVGGTLHQGTEGIEVAVLLGQPRAAQGSGVGHRRPFLPGRGATGRPITVILRSPDPSGNQQRPLKNPSIVPEPTPTGSLANPWEDPDMAHPYPLREIARQAGLSEATVDRVLNERGECVREPPARCTGPSPSSTGSGHRSDWSAAAS